ncbi:hypothetical protein EYF80_062118 [Liparis tanakae]|uniref:Uncharacterized protein n=1 Tax=Liparis tanakae TaxID=230148 RepID=A0A4Z2EG77_9TELE|nr:hypothetical protein EYF80_062118 [Liparis tanakae]
MWTGGSHVDRGVSCGPGGLMWTGGSHVDSGCGPSGTKDSSYQQHNPLASCLLGAEPLNPQVFSIRSEPEASCCCLPAEPEACCCLPAEPEASCCCLPASCFECCSSFVNKTQTTFKSKSHKT